ncbi:hypothetical protein Tco_0175273 [Tanacetum coccineum]
MQKATEMAIEVMDKRICTFVDRQTENKILTNNHNNNTKTRGRTLAGLMLQGLLRRNNIGDLNPYAQNEILTTMVCVLLNAIDATKLVILPAIGHFMRECPKLKNNNNWGNQVRGGNAPAKVYAVGHAGTNPHSNVVTDHYYDVELADGRIIGLNTILRGCTLNILNHPFNIDLMPIELGSFDAIIGMDWLGYEARLHIISYTKTQEYMLKGCPIFLANVNSKETEDKSEKKRLEEVPIVRDFPDVFPEDFLGLPPTQQVEFQIDLIPGTKAPVAISSAPLSIGTF